MWGLLLVYTIVGAICSMSEGLYALAGVVHLAFVICGNQIYAKLLVQKMEWVPDDASRQALS